LGGPDVSRLFAALPSSQGKAAWDVETEWSYLPIRRLRAVLQALRLIRVQNNQLVIVRSRYERFKQFPTTQQFYLLWHADAYHTAWGDFSGMWTAYMQLVQDNLPLL